MNKTVIITRGLPGSGKSTWAKKKYHDQLGQWKLVGKDSLRKLLDDGVWSKKNERFVVQVRDAIITEALESGYGVIVHDTNLEQYHVDQITGIAEKYNARVEIKDFDTPVEDCIANDLARGKEHGVVGESVIRKTHAKYLKPETRKAEYNPALQDVVICDLDGTIANLEHRSPYEASKCEGDGFHADVWEAVTAFVESRAAKGKRPLVILMSGRENKDRAPTERWLNAQGVNYDMLFMRATADSRKDSIVKYELYDRHIRGTYNCVAVYDDRDQVVNMWREQCGLRVFQVAAGDF